MSGTCAEIGDTATHRHRQAGPQLGDWGDVSAIVVPTWEMKEHVARGLQAQLMKHRRKPWADPFEILNLAFQ